MIHLHKPSAEGHQHSNERSGTMPMPPYYRVTKETKFGFAAGLGDTSEMVWEGRGAKKLLAEYPIRVLGGELDDPLARSADFTAGSTTHYIFEMWVNGVLGNSGNGLLEPGYWTRCEDPRDRLSWSVS